MAKRLSSKRLTGKSRPSTKSKFKLIKGVQRHSKRQSKKARDKASAKLAVAKRAAIHKPIKSTSNIHEAVTHKKDDFKKKFLAENVVLRDRNRGWNLKQKTYFFGGSALIYVSVESSSPFPVDSSAMEQSKFRSIAVKTDNRNGFMRNEKAFFEGLYTKRIHKNLGKMNFEDAKKVYERELSHEDANFIGMVNQLRADNKEGAIVNVEKIRWFKLIAN